jgi:hypothetical protein
MSATFATGRIALGLCDRCGRQYLLRELRDQVVDQKKTGLLVCYECFDVDHPQLQLGKVPIFDPQALRDPRPDKRTDVTNNPVFQGQFTPGGAPIFNTVVTPFVKPVSAVGVVPTARRD